MYAAWPRQRYAVWGAGEEGGGGEEEGEEEGEVEVEDTTRRRRRRGKEEEDGVALDGFDEEFQQLLRVINVDQSLLNAKETFEALAQLAQDFKHAALTYGRVIIAEMSLPHERKTIKPVEDAGGLAGGAKFLAGNIFFRFPRDLHGLYGSEEMAAKEANHQVKGLTAMYNAGIAGLNLPLCCVVKYRGVKLVAISELPIDGDKTLRYGSSDAGKNIGNSSDVDTLMRKAADALNLAHHPVENGRGQTWLHMPCDMEVHQCRIGGETRNYVLDFARLFPPQPPPQVLSRITRRVVKARVEGAHLVYMLRPELVREFYKPLSSDAFSRFASTAHPQFNRDVEEATMFLYNTMIPRAAARLREVDNFTSHTTTAVLHEHGINMRFLGLVFDRVRDDPKVLEQVLLEATARIVKAMVRGAQRVVEPSVRTAVLSPFMLAVSDTLNHVFGKATCSRCDPCDAPQACACLCDASLCQAQFNTERFALEAMSQALRASPDMPSQSSPEILETMEQEARRRCFWCKRLPALLEERYLFCDHASMREALCAIDDASSTSTTSSSSPSGTNDMLRCRCCSCLWKRCVHPAKLFARLDVLCGLELSPPCREAVQQAVDLERTPQIRRESAIRKFSRQASRENASSVDGTGTIATPKRAQTVSAKLGDLLGPVDAMSLTSFSSPVWGSSGEAIGGGGSSNSKSSPTPKGGEDQHSQRPLTVFDLFQPFETGDVVEVKGTIRVLPILEYGHGTALFIKSREKLGQGSKKEARRLGMLALKSFDAGLAVCPSDAKLLCNRGFLLGYLFESFGEGTQSAGLQQYLRGVRLNPTHARTWYYIATSLYKLYLEKGHKGAFDDSCMVSLDALRRQDNDRGVDGDFGSAVRRATPASLEMLRRIDFCFRKSIENDKTLVNCLKDFGNFKLHSLKQPEKAMELYRRALQVQPDHGRTLQNLASLQRDLGLWDAAIETLESNLKADANNPLLRLDLATCHIAVLMGEAHPDLRKVRTSFIAINLGIEPAAVWSALERVFGIVGEGITIFLNHSAKELERGHARARFFDLDDLDLHANLSSRASKCFLRIARLAMACWFPTVQAEGGGVPSPRAKQFFREICTSFDWAVHMIEADPIWLEFLDSKQTPREVAIANLKQKSAFRVRVLQLCKQLVASHLHYGVHLAKTLKPTINFDVHPSHVQVEAFGAKSDRRAAVAAAAAALAPAPGIQNLEIFTSARDHFAAALSLDTRPQSAAEQYFALFAQHFASPVSAP